MFNSSSLRFYLVSRLAVIFLCFTAAACAAFLFFAGKQDEAGFRSEALADRARGDAVLSERIRELRERLGALSSDKNVVAGLVSSDRAALTANLNARYPRANGVYFAVRDAQKEEFLPGDLPKEVIASLREFEKGSADASDNEEYRSGTGRVVFSRIVLSQNRRIGTAYCVYQPIDDDSIGQILGREVWEHVFVITQGGLARIGAQKEAPSPAPDDLGSLKPGDIRDGGIGGSDGLVSRSAVSPLHVYFAPYAKMRDFRLKALAIVGALGLAMLLLFVFLSFLLARKILGPIQYLVGRASAVSRGVKVAFTPPAEGQFAEFQGLNEAFDNMLDKLDEYEDKSRYKEFFDSVSDAVCISDMQGNIIEANETAYRVTGCGPVEMRTKKLWEIYDVAHPDKVFSEVFTGGETVFKVSRRSEDGRLQSVEVKAKLIFYKGHECILTLARDIGEWERAMDSIRTSEAKYRALFNTVSTAMAIVEKDKTIAHANDEFCRLCGVRRKAVEGFLSLENFLRKADCDKIGFFNVDKTQAPPPIPLDRWESELVRPDGTVRQVEIRVTEMPGVSQILIVLLDLTQRKALEAQVLQSEKLAALGQLISGVAHELNNPLASVVGYSELVQAGQASAKDKKHLEIIKNEALRASAIVKGLLTFARERKPEKQMIQVNEVLERTVGLRLYDFKVRNIQLVMNLDPQLPPTHADFFQLQVVFLNIINNAEHAMSENVGDKVLTVSSRLMMEGKVIEVEITDNGSGIPDEMKNRIFDPFVTTKEVGKGTGLGLSVSYGIVQEHQGQILVESNLDKGTAFKVRLPIMQTEAAETRRGETPSLPRPPGMEEKKVVLVVDDEPFTLELLKQFLAQYGCQAILAGDAIEGLKVLRTYKVDAIISDIRMPGIDGKGFLSNIESEFPDFMKKFVFITGDTVNQDIYNMLREKKIPCIFKPFGMNELREVLKSIMH